MADAPAQPGMLVVISGPSGAGKTTIARGVEEAFADAVFSVSVTTRPRTEADVEGVDYHFVDDAEFDRLVAAGELLEWAEVFDRRYGTPRRQVERALAAGRLVILEIDVHGARQVHEAMPEMFGLFILPPGVEALLERLRARRREDERVIQRRFAEAQREIEQARTCGVYDELIVNDDLQRALDEAVAVIADERERRGEG